MMHPVPVVRSVRRALVVVGAAAGLVLGAGVAPSVAADSCPNAAIRAQQHSEFLADCRAYEMVSPLAKNGIGVLANYTPNEISTIGGVSNTGMQLTPDGKTVLLTAAGVFPGAEGGPAFTRYVSRRGAGDWSVQPVDPPTATDTTIVRTELTFAMSDDGERVVVYSNKALAPGAVEGGRNVYVRDLVHGTYELVATGVSNWSDLGGYFSMGAITSSLSSFFFVSPALSPDDPDGAAYQYQAGRGAHAIAVQPVGAAAPIGGGLASQSSTVPSVSPDGRRKVVTLVEPGHGFFLSGLFFMEDGEDPVQVSASQRAGDDPAVRQPAVYVGASRDLSRIFFISPAALTDASDASRGTSLYRYDVATGTLTDLLAAIPTTDRRFTPTNPTAVSADGSSVYFMALGVLAPGAIDGAANLYLARNGDVRFVADLGGELHDIDRSQISSDGRYLAMQLQSSLTGYDSSGPACANGNGIPVCSQIYVYDAVTGTMSCASCSPDGSPPRGSSNFRPSQVPGLKHVSNVLTEDGKVAFESSDALVPQDVNGRRDVYTWQAGKLELISTGRGDSDSLFADMSTDGSTIAFATRQQLVGRDTDQLVDAYVARVDGGLVSQESSGDADGLGCRGADCQESPGVSPSLQRAGTEELSGDGQAPDDPPPAKKSTVAVRSKVVTGSSVRLSIVVSGPGTLVISGTGVTKVTKRAAKRGTAAVGVKLNAAARKSLARKGRLGVKVSVRFTPRAGGVSRTSTQVSFKKTRSKTARSAAPAINHGRVGR